MDEYIKRDDALMAISYYPIENPEQGDIIQAVLETARKAIAKINAADVAPVRHGRWRFCGSDRWNDAYECDNCGKMSEYNSNYCPNCGSKMDGGHDG